MLPLLSTIFIALCVGVHPKDLKLAVINKEVEDFNQCKIYLNELNQCESVKFSCHFLNEIKNETAVKIFYKTFDEAFMDARKGKENLIGILLIDGNVTENMQCKYEDDDICRTSLEMTFTTNNFVITNVMKDSLYYAYNNVIQRLSTSCNNPTMFNRILMRFEKPIYGKEILNYRELLIPGLSLLLSIKFNEKRVFFNNNLNLNFVLASP